MRFGASRCTDFVFKTGFSMERETGSEAPSTKHTVKISYRFR
jgi:hypothetical protein